MLVLKLRFDEEKILGISKKIIKGLVTPPVKNVKTLNCNISMTKKIKADLSDNWVLLYIYIKYILLKIPKKIIKFEAMKLNSKFRTK